MSSIDGLTVVGWVVAIPTWYQIFYEHCSLEPLILPTSTAWAVTVYLNGVAITGVPNQTFKNCTVTTDASGNVYIDAPAYKVEAPGQKRPLLSQALLSRQAWLQPSVIG